MSLIFRYIFMRCLFNTFLMLLAFVMLFAIFNIIGTAGDIGKGSFNTGAMLLYTIIKIPTYIYLFIPLAVLIGVMLTMLGLVNYSEYAIIRTSGVSLKKIAFILLVFGLTFSVITFLVGEVLAPTSDHYAEVYKKSKTNEMISAQLSSGIWSKDGSNTFVNIRQVMPDNTLVGIRIYHYDANLKLHDFMTAANGDFDVNKKVWILHDVRVFDYSKQNITGSNMPTYEWTTGIDPSYFSVLVITPEEMSALDLMQYISHMEKNNQSTQRYQIALWNKLLYPIACISMALIALAFIPNNRRNINLGSKLFVGILIGIAYFFAIRLIGFMALLFNWNAIFSSVMPTILLFGGGWYFVLRKE